MTRVDDLALHPLEYPLGEHSHHTEVPFTDADRHIGDRLSWFLGTLFSDMDDNPKYWHDERTSFDEWSRVARALRIHGLRIVDAAPTVGPTILERAELPGREGQWLDEFGRYYVLHGPTVAPAVPPTHAADASPDVAGLILDAENFALSADADIRPTRKWFATLAAALRALAGEREQQARTISHYDDESGKWVHSMRALQDSKDAWMDKCGKAEAALAAANADAARYRWLRDMRVIADDKPSIRIGPYWHAPLCWGEAADAAIDAAILARDKCGPSGG